MPPVLGLIDWMYYFMEVFSFRLQNICMTLLEKILESDYGKDVHLEFNKNQHLIKHLKNQHKFHFIN